MITRIIIIYNTSKYKIQIDENSERGIDLTKLAIKDEMQISQTIG